MTDIDKKPITYVLLGSIFSELERTNRVKKIKYTALVPIGHRTKQVTGIKEAAYPVRIETIKDLARIEVRNKHNKTIPFEDVVIESI